jgi:hypothetical protein
MMIIPLGRELEGVHLLTLAQQSGAVQRERTELRERERERERESLEKTKPSIYCSVSHYLRQINITNLSFTTRTILPENTRQSFKPQNNDLGGEVVIMLNPALAVRYPSLIVMRCNKSLVEEQNHPSE